MQSATATAERLADRDENFSVIEAGAYAGLSVAYLNKLRQVGGGPPFLKIGSRVLYRLSDLNDWLTSHRRKTTSDPGAR
jgi:Helix-turn-helix domain